MFGALDVNGDAIRGAQVGQLEPSGVDAQRAEARMHGDALDETTCRETKWLLVVLLVDDGVLMARKGIETKIQRRQAVGFAVHFEGGDVALEYSVLAHGTVIGEKVAHLAIEWPVGSAGRRDLKMEPREARKAQPLGDGAGALFTVVSFLGGRRRDDDVGHHHQSGRVSKEERKRLAGEMVQDIGAKRGHQLAESCVFHVDRRSTRPHLEGVYAGKVRWLLVQ